MGSALSVGLAVTLLGCASAPAVARIDDVGATSGPSTSRPTKPTVANYEVHEWGLLRAQVGDLAKRDVDAVTLGAVPPPVRHNYPMEKPVLYFHTDAALRLARATVTTPDSEIIEAWPIPTSKSRGSITWTDVAILPGGECAPTALPGARDLPCADLPAWVECESNRLDVVRTASAACVEAGSFRDRFLFYRALSTKFVPPLRFDAVGSSGDVKVTNIGSTPLPGLLVRLVPRDGSVDSVVAVPPAPSASITVGLTGVASEAGERIEEDQPDGGPGAAAIRQTLRDLGLDADEAGAFMRAWSPAFFSGTYPSEEKSIDLEPTPSFVYFLPAATIDAMSKLELDPPPRAVKRAFAVWAVLR